MYNRVQILIKGKNITSFFSEIVRLGINLYDIKKDTNKLLITIDYDDYLKILEWKTTNKITVINRYGRNKYIFLIKKYFVFGLLFLMGIFINIFLASLTMSIEVVHPNLKVQKLIIEDLKEYGIEKYHFKVSYEEKENIKNKILEKEKDKIEWLEIEEVGSKYIVKVEQKKKNSTSKKCSPRSIVAKKNALVLRIDAKSGEVATKKQEYVAKGQVLISGLIHNKDKIVAKQCAEGKVYGEVWYKVKVEIPKEKEYIVGTGSKQFGITLQFLKNRNNYSPPYLTYTKKVYNIIESDFIPLSIGIGIFEKTKKYQKKLSEKELEKIALDYSEKKLKKTIKKSDKIIDKKVLKKEAINSKINIEVFYKVEEDITTYLDITDIDITKENEKEE